MSNLSTWRNDWGKDFYRVILIKGKVRYYYNIEAKNGQILVTSQRYWSRSNAKKAANKVAVAFNIQLVV